MCLSSVQGGGHGHSIDSASGDRNWMYGVVHLVCRCKSSHVGVQKEKVLAGVTQRTSGRVKGE